MHIGILSHVGVHHSDGWLYPRVTTTNSPTYFEFFSKIPIRIIGVRLPSYLNYYFLSLVQKISKLFSEAVPQAVCARLIFLRSKDTNQPLSDYTLLFFFCRYFILYKRRYVCGWCMIGDTFNYSLWFKVAKLYL